MICSQARALIAGRLARAALCVALVGAGLAATGTAHPSAARSSHATITVNAAATLGTIPGTAFGINTAVWDNLLLDPPLPRLLRQAGVTMMRYPGGSTADVYHWRSNTTEQGQSYANPRNTFDAFMGVVHRTGARAIITVNYGSGTPQEAAGWVNYANKGGAGYTGPVPTYPGASSSGHTDGITYWEIGNELYGNGSYGTAWEFDRYTKSQGPIAYGRRAEGFISAMKAIDPSIKVGVVLTAPGNWPDEDALGNAGTTRAWNDNVLAVTCAALDFVDVHWYPQDPGQESDANLLQSPQSGIAARTDSIAEMVTRLHAEIKRSCPSRAGLIPILLTETNAVSYNPGKQTVSLPNALFLADSYMTWLENGVRNVDWWDTHNSIVTGQNNGSTLYGTAQYGDYGALSNGSSSNGYQEPPAETPFPPYDGLAMLTRLGRPGDQMVAATSTRQLLSAHAVRQASGNLAVLLVNKSPDLSYTVTLSLSGYTAATGATIYRYGMGSRGITTAREGGLPSTRALSVPPYALTVIVLTPRTIRRAAHITARRPEHTITRRPAHTNVRSALRRASRLAEWYRRR